MTALLLQNEKTKDTPPPEKPGGEAKQPPEKTQEKASGKDTPTQTGQDLPPKDAAQPPANQDQPVIPIAPPPGANQAVKVQEPPGKFQIGTILEPALWLIGILTAGALMIAWLKKNRDRPLGTVTLTANQQLTAFRDSLEEGDMTEDEFKKVKALLADKIRKPAKPVTAAPDAPVVDEPDNKHGNA